MSEEERSAERKHRSVLAGMSRKEAEALVALAAHGNSSLWTGEAGPGGEDLDAPSLERLLALAALGARCVGAKMGEATCVSAEGYEDSGVVDVRTAVVGPVALGATVLVLEGE